MTPDGRRGAGFYRCGCGAGVAVTAVGPPSRKCWYDECRTLATTRPPLQFCLEHEHSAAGLLARLGAEATLQRWLDTSPSTRYRAFGSALNVDRAGGKHLPVVYFMRRERLIKIGTSTNLGTRASQLAMRVLATIEGGESTERRLHARFAPLLAFGREWFHPAPSLIAYINEIRGREGRPPIDAAQPGFHHASRAGSR
ncbi:hypothetical protein GCM10010361_17660 [Streptomyces olivaceiscleroticus]|uniref:GIY-YIG nuclease family protein n=1 Tax=Streptomyces olivaceiscleroticus TaxID=68245 RepID=A0ABN0ZNV2_9ACTN